MKDNNKSLDQQLRAVLHEGEYIIPIINAIGPVFIAHFRIRPPTLLVDLKIFGYNGAPGIDFFYANNPFEIKLCPIKAQAYYYGRGFKEISMKGPKDNWLTRTV